MAIVRGKDVKLFVKVTRPKPGKFARFLRWLHIGGYYTELEQIASGDARIAWDVE